MRNIMYSVLKYRENVCNSVYVSQILRSDIILIFFKLFI